MQRLSLLRPVKSLWPGFCASFPAGMARLAMDAERVRGVRFLNWARRLRL